MGSGSSKEKKLGAVATAQKWKKKKDKAKATDQGVEEETKRNYDDEQEEEEVVENIEEEEEEEEEEEKEDENEGFEEEVQKEKDDEVQDLKDNESEDGSVRGDLTDYSEKMHKALVGGLDTEFPENLKVVRIFTSSTFTEKLLTDALSFAKKYCTITARDIDIIMHARKSLLFNNGTPWIKKKGNMFDVTMGSYDGAEICELVGLFILNKLCAKYGKDYIGLYRDDGLAVFKNTSGPQADRIRKDITKLFKHHGLNITIQTNLKIVNFLDVTFDLANETYCPYRKPNDQPLYINTKSNHPPNIIKQLPDAINRRISNISCNKTEFDKAKPIYEHALNSSGYTKTLTYNNHKPSTHSKRNRQRNIIWYNPPYSKNVQTKVGSIFLKLIHKHFPKHHRFHRIFNKNNIKVSYSCMENMKTNITKHNKKIFNTDTDPATTSEKTCNCRKKDQCPLNNNCLSSSIIYNAHVTTNEDTTGKNYIGLTEGTFKQRYTQHKLSLRNRKYANSTELSKYIWDLKDNNKDYNIEWTIITSARPYSNISKRCDLCLTEKLLIIKANSDTLLNKRSELISKCRHENKFYLMNNRNPGLAN